MSVVVKRLKSSSMEVYVKGAPEVMGDICNKESCKQHYSVNFLVLSESLQSLMTTMIFYRIILSVVIVSLPLLARASKTLHG